MTRTAIPATRSTLLGRLARATTLLLALAVLMPGIARAENFVADSSGSLLDRAGLRIRPLNAVAENRVAEAALRRGAQGTTGQHGFDLASFDVDADGYSDLIVGDPEANEVRIYFGGAHAPYPFPAEIQDNPDMSSIDTGAYALSIIDTETGYDRYATLQGPANTRFGFSVAVGQISSSPVLIIGAPGQALDTAASGGVWIVFGPFTPPAPGAGPATIPSGQEFTDGEPGSRLGWDVAALTDGESAGTDHVIASAPGAQSESGKVFELRWDGSALGSVVEFTGAAGEQVGESIAICDLQGDADFDVAVGATVPGQPGKVVVFNDGLATSPTATIPGQSSDDFFGFSVACGNLFGTDADEIAVSAIFDDVAVTNYPLACSDNPASTCATDADCTGSATCLQSSRSNAGTVRVYDSSFSLAHEYFAQNAGDRVGYSMSIGRVEPGTCSNDATRLCQTATDCLGGATCTGLEQLVIGVPRWDDNSDSGETGECGGRSNRGALFVFDVANDGAGTILGSLIAGSSAGRLWIEGERCNQLGRGVALGDWNRDGWLELFTASGVDPREPNLGTEVDPGTLWIFTTNDNDDDGAGNVRDPDDDEDCFADGWETGGALEEGGVGAALESPVDRTTDPFTAGLNLRLFNFQVSPASGAVPGDELVYTFQADRSCLDLGAGERVDVTFDVSNLGDDICVVNALPLPAEVLSLDPRDRRAFNLGGRIPSRPSKNGRGGPTSVQAAENDTSPGGAVCANAMNQATWSFDTTTPITSWLDTPRSFEIRARVGTPSTPPDHFVEKPESPVVDDATDPLDPSDADTFRNPLDTLAEIRAFDSGNAIKPENRDENFGNDDLDGIPGTDPSENRIDRPDADGIVTLITGRIAKTGNCDGSNPCNAGDPEDPGVPQGDAVSYTIAIWNDGDQDSGPGTVTDTLPIGFQCTQVTPSSTAVFPVDPACACPATGVSVVCNFTNIPASSSMGSPAAEITIDGYVLNDATLDIVAPTGLTTLTNQVDLAIDFPGAPTNPLTTVTGDQSTLDINLARMSFDKSFDPIAGNTDPDNSQDISVGDTLTFDYEVTNLGAEGLTNLTIVDPLPGLTVVDCPAAPGTDLLPAPSPPLACTATYLVQAGDITATQISSTATAMVDQEMTRTSTVTLQVQAPAATFDKTHTNADEDSSGDVSVGDTLTYRLLLTNTGTANLSNVTVVDNSPIGLGPLTCNTSQPAFLSQNDTLDCTASYTVQASDVAAGQIDNTAEANSSQLGLMMATETIVVPQPLLSLDKSFMNADGDNSTDVSVGDVLTYRLQATNTGTATLTGVTIVDPLPGLDPLTCNLFQPAMLTQGQTLDCTAAYTVTASDVTAGMIQNTATADSFQTPAVTDSETISVPQPAMTLAKTRTITDPDLSGDVSVGDVVTYRFLVTNTGTANLTGVSVSDPLSGLSALTCNVTQPVALLAPAATLDCTATYTVQAADVTATQIQNTATAVSVQTTAMMDTVTISVPQPTMTFDKTFSNADEDTSGDVSLNDTITYRFLVTNTGTANLTNVSISDPLSGLSALACNVTQPVALLAPAATLDCTATYTVQAADVTAAQIVNTATADSVQTAAEMDTETIPIPQPGLTFAKTHTLTNDADSSGDVSANDTITYRFLATNNGLSSLTNVMIIDPLSGLSGLSCNTTQPAVLAPSQTLDCTATYTVQAADVTAGQILNTATVSSAQLGSMMDSDTVSVPQPTLNLQKTRDAAFTDADLSGDISPGDTLTYRFAAANDGNANLTNVSISDGLPGLSGLTCVPSQAVPLLAPTESLNCSATYVVQAADVTAGQIVNTATATSVQTGNVQDMLTSPLPQPILGLSKSRDAAFVDADTSGDVSVGDTLTYRFVATNAGTANLTNVQITDMLPGLGSLTCNLAQPADLTPAQTLECTAPYVVTQANVNDGEINNEATADCDQTGPVMQMFTVPLGAPALALDKSVDAAFVDGDLSGDFSVGDTLTYRFVATNNGTANLTGVTIVDMLPGLSVLACTPAQPASLTPTTNITCTATYVITQANVNDGQISNTGQADSDQTSMVTDDLITSLPQPTLQLSKTLDSNADEDVSGTVSVGDTLTYRFVATNGGTANLTNVTIIDMLPGLSPLSCNTPQPATLSPAGTLDCTATYVVTAANEAAGQIVNTAMANSDQTSTVSDGETVVVP